MKRIGILVVLMLFIWNIPSYAFDSVLGSKIHQQITREALSFLKPDILDQVVSGNDFWFDIQNQTHTYAHFDDCDFSGSFDYINNQYNLLIAAGLEGDTRAPEFFGNLLHPVQDFYAHSNWVDLGQSYLFEDSYGLWNNGSAPRPFALWNGFIILEGSDREVPEYLDLSREPNSKDVIVTDSRSNETMQGVMTGVSYGLEDCPRSIAMNHWDIENPTPKEIGPVDFGPMSGLNKDDSSRAGFNQAYALAVLQTQHEWCRLLYLVSKNDGQAKAQSLLNSWVSSENQEQALNMCAAGTLEGSQAQELTKRDFDYCSATYQSLAHPIIPSSIPEGTSYVDIDQGLGVYLYDAYANVIEMPPGMTPESLFADTVFNMDTYLNATIFPPGGKVWYYHEEPQWKELLPMVGDALVEAIKFTGTPTGQTMPGAKVITEVSANRVVMTSFEKSGRQHPLLGSRELGFEVNSNGYVTFYTRSVARPSQSLVDLQPTTPLATSNAASYMFSAQEGWTFWIAGINKKVRELGGRVIDPIARNINTFITPPCS